MPGLPTMPMGMPMNANNGVLPWMRGLFATGVEPWQQLPSASDMKKFRQIRQARTQAWKDWMLSTGLANLDPDESNEEGEEDGEGEPETTESKRASNLRVDPRSDWLDHLQQMRWLGPSAPWLDEEFSNVLFGNHRCCSKANGPRRRAKMAHEDSKCRFSPNVSTLAPAGFTLYRSKG